MPLFQDQPPSRQMAFGDLPRRLFVERGDGCHPAVGGHRLPRTDVAVACLRMGRRHTEDNHTAVFGKGQTTSHCRMEPLCVGDQVVGRQHQ